MKGLKMLTTNALFKPISQLMAFVHFTLIASCANSLY